MSPRKKKILLVTIAAGLLLAFLLIGIRMTIARRKPEPASLVFFYQLSAQDDAALQTVLQRFRGLYPHITLSTRNSDPLSMQGADIVAAPGYMFSTLTSETKKAEAYTPVPWSGPVWTLAARKDLLDTAAKALPSEINALRSGNATPDMFRSILAWFRQSGIAPITLGNSHRWPFMLWLQHWAAATVDTIAVSAIPAANLDGTDPYAALRPAFEELKSWRKLGYFELSSWNEGWARGLLPLVEGRSAFALVSLDYLSPIPEDKRGDLEFLPFPRAQTDAPWSIGSATYLGLVPGTAEPEAASLLLRFLSSPGATEELTRITGKPFFAWNAKSGEFRVVVPSWLEASATQEFDMMSKVLDPLK